MYYVKPFNKKKYTLWTLYQTDGVLAVQSAAKKIQTAIVKYTK